MFFLSPKGRVKGSIPLQSSHYILPILLCNDTSFPGLIISIHIWIPHWSVSSVSQEEVMERLYLCWYPQHLTQCLAVSRCSVRGVITQKIAWTNEVNKNIHFSKFFPMYLHKYVERERTSGWYDFFGKSGIQFPLFLWIVIMPVPLHCRTLYCEPQFTNTHPEYNNETLV